MNILEPIAQNAAEITQIRRDNHAHPELCVEEVRTADVVAPDRGLVSSFRVAFDGVLRTMATQRNMKVHVVAGLMVAIVGMALPLDLSVRVSLLFAVSIVFFAEILNTALEALIDLFVHDFHHLAMVAKDAAAGDGPAGTPPARRKTGARGQGIIKVSPAGSRNGGELSPEETPCVRSSSMMPSSTIS